MKEEVKKAINLLEKEVQTNYVKHLISNPGMASGYNEEMYLRNDTWNRKRNAKAKRALIVLKDILYF